MFNPLDCDHNTLDTRGIYPLDSQICFTCVQEYALKSSIEDGEDYEYCLEQVIDVICCGEFRYEN